ncbi:hypothetical protein FA95DRAFT_562623 [Auriscalpium vulgare]|uniref:Uncharacterized protein n=1 Tax=Auriscalpium vulgare TaxID=40419 RepID=A0ACB8RF23_9AGAM|nr:hypothetical protein FA95DRAFT_562623 [Auriscalpium vulgare]
MHPSPARRQDRHASMPLPGGRRRAHRAIVVAVRHVTGRRRQCHFNLKAIVGLAPAHIARDAHAALGPSASLDEDQLAALAIHGPDKLNPPYGMVLLGAGPTGLVLAQRRRRRSVGGVLKFQEIADVAHDLKDIRGAVHSAHDCGGRTFQARVLDAQTTPAHGAALDEAQSLHIARRLQDRRERTNTVDASRVVQPPAGGHGSKPLEAPNIPFQLIAPGCTFLKRGSLLHFERWSFPKQRDIFLFSDSLI